MRFHLVPPGATITERKRTVDGREQTFPCDLLARGPGLAIILFRITDPAAFDTPVPIADGTRSLGYFWEHRPISAYRFINSAGEAIIHRFDAVTGVTLSDTEIAFRDLVLDWWVLPGDILSEEDRDDFESLQSAGALSENDILSAQSATRLVYSRYRHIIDEMGKLQRRLDLDDR